MELSSLCLINSNLFGRGLARSWLKALVRLVREDLPFRLEHQCERTVAMVRRARDVLIDILRDEGITHVFGNPGSTEMPLMDALVDAPDITYVLGLQEATAVGMADGWALASGRAAFVNLHAMGGLGNAMGVLVASKASETPL